MKKIFIFIFALFVSITLIGICSEEIVVIEQGSAINYPLLDDEMIECYAKRTEGSIDHFIEYNEYFKSKNGKLYTNLLNKLYKPNKSNPWKKPTTVDVIENGRILHIYDCIFHPATLRLQQRKVNIDLQTGEYYMRAMQDNWSWYRNGMASGWCRVIKNNLP